MPGQCESSTREQASALEGSKCRLRRCHQRCVSSTLVRSLLMGLCSGPVTVFERIGPIDAGGCHTSHGQLVKSHLVINITLFPQKSKNQSALGHSSTFAKKIIHFTRKSSTLSKVIHFCEFPKEKSHSSKKNRVVMTMREDSHDASYELEGVFVRSYARTLVTSYSY